MLQMRRDINQRDFKIVDIHFVQSKWLIFTQLQLQQAQLQVGKNSNWIILRLMN